MEHLIDIGELSEVLSVRVKTLRDWVWKEKIPVYKLNGQVRFKPSEIEAWVERNKRVAKGETFS